MPLPHSAAAASRIHSKLNPTAAEKKICQATLDTLLVCNQRAWSSAASENELALALCLTKPQCWQAAALDLQGAHSGGLLTCCSTLAAAAKLQILCGHAARTGRGQVLERYAESSQ